MARALVATRFRGDDEKTITVQADEIERDDSLIYAWKNNDGKRRLVAVISIGSYDAICLTDTWPSMAPNMQGKK